MTHAAMAATSSVKKSRLFSWANNGAMSTPARLASTLDRIHEKSDTRCASTPWSCRRRGLSTTARICSPTEARRMMTRPITTRPVATRVAIWLASSTNRPLEGQRKSSLRLTGHSGGGFTLGADDQQHDLGNDQQAERGDELGQGRRVRWR